MVSKSTLPLAKRDCAIIMKITLETSKDWIVGLKKEIPLIELNLWTSLGSLGNGKPWKCGTKQFFGKK